MAITHKTIKTFRTKKLKGFTIVETLVAMLLGGLAIAFAAWAFLTVSENFQRSREDYGFYTEILQLRSVLGNDMEKAKSVRYENGALDLELPGSGTAWYDFYEDYTIRGLGEAIDTFRVACSDFKSGYHPSRPEQLVSFSFTIYAKGKPWEQLFFYNDYPARLNGVLFDE